MIRETTTVTAPDGPMNAYVARPDRGAPHPAVIVLEGIYGFDDELRRITDLVASHGYVGCAIDYLRGRKPTDHFVIEEVCRDVAAARDYCNGLAEVQHGKIATWGFGWGGTAAFLSATLPGLSGAICFYGQSIAKPLPGGEPPPIDDVTGIRAPLLLIFGGHDELIAADDVARIREQLTASGKRYDLEVYPNVGHSFFREDLGTIATREIADAWDRTAAFLERAFH